MSNLDPILDDEGFYGVKLALEDNLTTGRFLGHDYKAEFHRVLQDENLVNEFEKLLKNGKNYFVVDLNKSELLSLMKIPGVEDVFNLIQELRMILFVMRIVKKIFFIFHLVILSCLMPLSNIW